MKINLIYKNDTDCEDFMYVKHCILLSVFYSVHAFYFIRKLRFRLYIEKYYINSQKTEQNTPSCFYRVSIPFEGVQMVVLNSNNKFKVLFFDGPPETLADQFYEDTCERTEKNC